MCMLHIHEKKKKQKQNKCTNNEKKEKMEGKEGYKKETQDSKQMKEIFDNGDDYCDDVMMMLADEDGDAGDYGNDG